MYFHENSKSQSSYSSLLYLDKNLKTIMKNNSTVCDVLISPSQEDKLATMD